MRRAFLCEKDKFTGRFFEHRRFKMKVQDIARQLYLENNWDMPDGFKKTEVKDPLNFTQAEGQQAKRVKIEPKALKEMFKKCWERFQISI